MTTRKEPFFLEYEVCHEWNGSGIARSKCQRSQGHDGDHGPRLTDEDRRLILLEWLGLEDRLADMEEALHQNGIYA